MRGLLSQINILSVLGPDVGGIPFDELTREVEADLCVNFVTIVVEGSTTKAFRTNKGGFWPKILCVLNSKCFFL